MRPRSRRRKQVWRVDWFRIYEGGNIAGFAIRLDGMGIDRERAEWRMISKLLAQTSRWVMVPCSELQS